MTVHDDIYPNGVRHTIQDEPCTVTVIDSGLYGGNRYSVTIVTVAAQVYAALPYPEMAEGIATKVNDCVWFREAK